MRSLSRHSFISLLEHDENRALDGIELRREYEEYARMAAPSGPCSILEVLIGLARRMAYITYDPDLSDEDQLSLWFWEMIDNLDINPLRGADSNMMKILCWIERRFDKNGEGSPFPLRFSRKNQKRVELWYQMQAYILEKM